MKTSEQYERVRKAIEAKAGLPMIASADVSHTSENGQATAAATKRLKEELSLTLENVGGESLINSRCEAARSISRCLNVY
jgi:hypothetical protein